MAPGVNVTAFAVRRGLSRDGWLDIGGRFREAYTPAVDRPKLPFLAGRIKRGRSSFEQSVQLRHILGRERRSGFGVTPGARD